MFRFHNPSALSLIVPLLLMAVAWYLLEKNSIHRLKTMLSNEMLWRLLEGYSGTRKKARFILLWLACLFGVLALARPQMGTREESAPTTGLDIVFLLDVSNSMATEDIIPSRLKKAKHVVKTFLEKMSGDRVGVVAFAGSAYPAVPLTTDYEFIKQSLEILDHKAITNQGTNIGKALKVGFELIDRGGMTEDTADTKTPEEGASRVMIVISDGEDQVGEESGVAKELRSKGVLIYAIGVGSAKGGPIPLRDDNGESRGFKKDSSGNMVLTRLESRALESLASIGSGKYYMASSNEGEVDEIISSLSSLDRSEGVGKRVIVYEEYFQYPLALGMVFFLLMLFMSEARRPAKVAAMILLLSFQSQATTYREYESAKKGVDAYRAEDYAGATNKFADAQAENPDVKQHAQNLGAALLKSKSPDLALKEFDKVIESKDVNESARGSYNKGKTFDAMENHEMALRTYQDALDRLRQSPDADTEVVMKLKRALETSQQKQQQKQQSKDKDKDKKESDDKKEQKDKQDGDNEKKDDKENEKKDEPKNYKNPKPKFKPEKLGEEDAKRVLKQLQEQEKKTQMRLMKNKTKSKEEKNGKDW